MLKRKPHVKNRHSDHRTLALALSHSSVARWWQIGIISLCSTMNLITPLQAIDQTVDKERQTHSPSLQRYFDLYTAHPDQLGPLGNQRQGEIQILLDPVEIAHIEQLQLRRLIQEGMSESLAAQASRVGIISQDKYWYFLRDAVIFPSGAKGLYNRIIPLSSLNGPTGVVIAPLLPDGRLALILNFRHATRSWELELPRGGRYSTETPEQAAIRETLEETGYRLQNPTQVGEVHPDSGIATCSMSVIVGFASEKRASHVDQSEAIKGVIALSKNQIKEAYRSGYIELHVAGQMQKLSLKDPYIAYILVVAAERGLW